MKKVVVSVCLSLFLGIGNGRAQVLDTLALHENVQTLIDAYNGALNNIADIHVPKEEKVMFVKLIMDEFAMPDAKVVKDTKGVPFENDEPISVYLKYIKVYQPDGMSYTLQSKELLTTYVIGNGLYYEMNILVDGFVHYFKNNQQLPINYVFRVRTPIKNGKVLTDIVDMRIYRIELKK